MAQALCPATRLWRLDQSDIMYDPECEAMLCQYTWRIDSNGYVVTTVNGARIYMHRLIAERMGLDLSNGVVDHINNHRHDNRSSNLSVLTLQDNCNRTKYVKRKTNLPPNIYKHKHSNHYTAKVNQQYLGFYDSIEKAEAAVQKYRDAFPDVVKLANRYIDKFET